MEAREETPEQPDVRAADGVRHLPVLAAPEPRALEPARATPPSELVVAATGGFLAAFGAVLVMRLLRGAARRPAGLRRLGARRRGAALEVVGTRSFLVDVHLLRR